MMGKMRFKLKWLCYFCRETLCLRCHYCCAVIENGIRTQKNMTVTAGEAVPELVRLLSYLVTPPSWVSCLRKICMRGKLAHKLLPGKLIPTPFFSWLLGLTHGTLLPGIWCPCSIAQARHTRGQNSKNNSQILLLLNLRYQLQPAFCVQSAASGPPASAAHNLKNILGIGYNFKWRNKHVATYNFTLLGSVHCCSWNSG